MKIIKKDMLKIRSGILFHQVNCQSTMGGGIAYALAKKFPGLEEAYQEFSRTNVSLLGKVFLFKVSDELFIANVFGQNSISTRSRQTSYDATVEAFELMQKPLLEEALKDLPLYFPYQMGCGLGGGNWKIYASIIEAYFPNATICQLQENPGRFARRNK